jgi:hypothetical protein
MLKDYKQHVISLVVRDMRDKPIFSSERMLHKDYYRRSSVEKKNFWSWVSRGSMPRRTDGW